ncbi:MAG TPA: aldo/keto reductase [Acetobacteraceae bacterium]|nr:aldo/keto reductase [Acetobacteraceae bacterium]
MVSVLGYGAGAVGGLLVRGDARDRERSVARAIELGINYFDTAAIYGNGESERTLGPILKRLGAAVLVGTKVRITTEQRGDIAGAIAASMEESLKRLGRDSVDVFHLHDPITAAGQDPAFTVGQVLEEAVPALRRLQEQGKTRFIGITALGDTPALKTVLASGAFDTAQCVYNLLNPSGVSAMPPGLPGQDFDGLMRDAQAHGVGTIGIRVLAAGALSGTEERHPGAMPAVAPIASGPSYAADVAAARRLLPLVAEGHAESLVELAIRFAISSDAMSTILVGTADLEQQEIAAAAVAKGPLPRETLARIAELQAA